MHPDKKLLGEALAKVRIFADELNESKREAESCTKVLTIQRKLTDNNNLVHDLPRLFFFFYR